MSKHQSVEIKTALIINKANEYKKETGKFPERQKLAQLTGISAGTVAQMIRDIKKTTGLLYARDLTAQERVLRSKQSREGIDYEYV